MAVRGRLGTKQGRAATRIICLEIPALNSSTVRLCKTEMQSVYAPDADETFGIAEERKAK